MRTFQLAREDALPSSFIQVAILEFRKCEGVQYAEMLRHRHGPPAVMPHPLQGRQIAYDRATPLVLAWSEHTLFSSQTQKVRRVIPSATGCSLLAFDLP